jgi:hypothetical protein
MYERQQQQQPNKINAVNALKQAAPVTLLASLAIASGEAAPTVAVEPTLPPAPVPNEHTNQVGVLHTQETQAHHAKKQPLKFWYGTAPQLQTIKQEGHTANAILAYKHAAKRPWYSWRQMRCLDLLWYRESKFDEHADNPLSPAHGIPQANPGSKMSKAGKDWQSNPKTQIRWGIDDYIEVKYIVPCTAWGHSQAYGWY